MQIKEIAELIQIIEKSAIEEFELERSGVRIRVKKGVPQASGVTKTETEVHLTAATAPVQAEPTPVAAESEDLFVFKAPIVGTFYLTPKPDAAPFLRVGDFVSEGTVVCIIEAMKIFNQIECEVEGEVVRILVENGQPVEYGEPLFQIRLAS